MTINNPSEYLRNLWDWQCLSGCFGDSKISPTDIDGFVERNSFFLVIETKAPDVPLKTGQRITFEKLVSIPQFSVVVVWGHPHTPEKIMVWYDLDKQKEYTGDDASLEKLREIVSGWYRYADGR